MRCRSEIVSTFPVFHDAIPKKTLNSSSKLHVERVGCVVLCKGFLEELGFERENNTVLGGSSHLGSGCFNHG